MNNFSPHQCLQCGKPLQGRIDKKFCDAYCRNTFNNQNKATDEQFIQLVVSRIRKNRRILKTLSPEGKATVRKELLEEMGYNFRFHTEIFHTSNGTYYLCHDYGYMPIMEGTKQKAVIVKRQTYVDDRTFDPWMK